MKPTKVTKEMMLGLMLIATILSGAAFEIGWVAVSLAFVACALVCLAIATEMK